MRAVVGRMPIWSAGENADVVETAMLMGSKAAEYREVAGADAPDGQQGLKGAEGRRAAGADAPDGAEPVGLKNNQDFKGQEGLRA